LFIGISKGGELGWCGEAIITALIEAFDGGELDEAASRAASGEDRNDVDRLGDQRAGTVTTAS
jgi:hypothetical protein